MKLSTDGLTLGTIKGLEAKGYKVVMEDGGQFVDVSLEPSVSLSTGLADSLGWGSLGEYME